MNECTCGHVMDEHEDGGQCQAEEADERHPGTYFRCMCVAFEAVALAEPASREGRE